jgi:cell division protein FtsN
MQILVKPLAGMITTMNKALIGVCFAVLLGLGACSRQQSDWEKTRAANTTEAYEQFLKKYPSGEFSAQAQARVKELYEERDWQKARDADTQEAYQVFLKQYPEGKWAEEARIRVENFTLAQAPPNATPAPASATPPAASSAPKPAPAPATPKPAPAFASGSYGVQLGAFKSSAGAADKRWARLHTEYPKLLAGLSPSVTPKKSDSGTLYRLQVEGLSEKRARAICKALKARAQACVLIRPARATGHARHQ